MAAMLVMTGFGARSGHTSSKASFSIKPPPSWVLTVPAAANRPVPADAGGGIYYILEDHQRRVAGNSTERYTHQVRKIMSGPGLETASQIKLEFEPSYQELIFHHISIRRGDRTIDALKPAEIRMIQQETHLDEQKNNGQFSALVFLSDVRVGDVIDYSYSINGSNPVLTGRYADVAYLAGDSPIQI